MSLNMKIVSHEKLHNFRIGNLKCLGEIWRMRQKFSGDKEGQRALRGFD
jgi:hypothetical protein